MKRFCLFLCCLWCGLLSICAQRADAHSVLVYGKAGYSRVAAVADGVSASGGMGAGIGVGYEYRYKDFLFHTGLDVQRMSSHMAVGMMTHTEPMRDTSGRLFNGIFEFNDNDERHTLVGLTVPVMAGLALRDWYFLAGVKLQLNFSGKVSTASTVTARARYDMIVGIDGNGLLYDMPNHGLGTTRREIEGELPLFPVYQLSAEVGKTFRPHPAARHRSARAEYMKQVRENNKSFKRHTFSGHSCRLALFCDYGFASLKDSSPRSDKVVNLALQPRAYAPTLNHMVYSSKSLNTLFVGVKFAVLFEFANKYDCQCY